MTEVQAKQTRPYRITLGGLAARVGILLVSLPVLTALVVAAMGANSDQPTAYRWAYAFGRFLIPWLIGGAVLFVTSWRKPLGLSNLGVAILVMGSLGLLLAILEFARTIAAQ